MSTPAENQNYAPRPRVLLVDDEPVNLCVLSELFREDYEVITATSGEEALAQCRLDPPDLLLLDIVMPGMDGLDVCRRLKGEAATREVPVIFITALGRPQEETAALETGAVDFISKPVNPAVVRARVRTHLTLKAQSDFLRSLAFLDGLTGVANRRRFDEVLEAEWRRHRRHAASLGLIMLDIDQFKHFNDTYGHQAGDACLRALAQALADRMRRSHDLAARYGGEEFACILPETDLAGTRLIAESLLEAIRGLAIPHEDVPAGKVTASLGLAVMVPATDEGPALLVAQADGKLYAGKTSGRNRIAF